MKYKNLTLPLLLLTLIGCTTSTPTAEQSFSTQTPTPQQFISATPKIMTIKIASGGDEQWTILGNAFAAQIAENVPNAKVETASSDSVMENLKLLTSGKVSMAFGYDYHAALANQIGLASVFPYAESDKINIKCGVEITRMPFPDYTQQIRIAATLYEQPLRIITTQSSGITKLSDLSKKRISTGVPNSITEELAGYIFTALDIKEKDFTRHQLDIHESIAALKDDRIDVIFWVGNIPKEITALSDIKILPINSADAENIIRLNPGVFHKSNLPADTYIEIEKDIETLAVTVALLTMEDFPDTELQQIITAIFENQQKLAITENLILENSLNLLNEESRAYAHAGLMEYIKSLAK